MALLQKKAGIASTRYVVLGAVAIGASVAAWAASSTRLVFNGQVASRDVRIINGQAYVPVRDMAKALDMVAVKRADGSYEVKKAGGATPVQGLNGKIGEVLFDGKWRFQVLSIQETKSYIMKTDAGTDYSVYRQIANFDVPTKTFTPLDDNKLIVFQCRVTNARNSNQALWVYNPETRTALADYNGTSHPPIGYDFAGAPHQSQALLPGAALNFAVLFSVPQDTRPKDLVFTLRNISEKGNDVRVALGN